MFLGLLHQIPTRNETDSPKRISLGNYSGRFLKIQTGNAAVCIFLFGVFLVYQWRAAFYRIFSRLRRRRRRWRRSRGGGRGSSRWVYRSMTTLVVVLTLKPNGRNREPFTFSQSISIGNISRLLISNNLQLT